MTLDCDAHIAKPQTPPMCEICRFNIAQNTGNKKKDGTIRYRKLPKRAGKQKGKFACQVCHEECISHISNSSSYTEHLTHKHGEAQLEFHVQ